MSSLLRPFVPCVRRHNCIVFAAKFASFLDSDCLRNTWKSRRAFRPPLPNEFAGVLHPPCTLPLRHRQNRLMKLSISGGFCCDKFGSFLCSFSIFYFAAQIEKTLRWNPLGKSETSVTSSILAACWHYYGQVVCMEVSQSVNRSSVSQSINEIRSFTQNWWQSVNKL